MARNPGAVKRQKELGRQERQREKIAKREARKLEKKEKQAQRASSDVDPDIAGIVPGPQPPPEE